MTIVSFFDIAFFDPVFFDTNPKTYDTSDRFFTARMRDGYRKHFAPDLTEIRAIGYSLGANYHNMGIMSVIGNTKVFGSEIEIGSTASTDNAASGYVRCYRFTTGVPNTWYDRVAGNIQSAAGNERRGCYDDSGSNPNNLYSESASVAVSNGFNWRIVPEFMLTMAEGWTAVQYSSNACVFYYLGSGLYRLHSVAYGAFTNPFGSVDASGSVYNENHKIGHS